LVENSCLNPPHLYLVSPLGVILLEFRRDFRSQKTRVPHDDSIYRASVASRGKKTGSLDHDCAHFKAGVGPPFQRYGWWLPKFKWFTWPEPPPPLRGRFESVDLHLQRSTYLPHLKSLTPPTIWRYERRYKILKWGYFEVIVVTQGHWKERHSI